MFSKSVGEWLSARGPSADIVLSTRARLARNLAGVHFPNRADAGALSQVVTRTEKVLRELSVFESGSFQRGEELTPVERRYLMERHLVSAEFVTSNRPRALFVSASENISVMMNEEDHLRIQVLVSGLDFESALTELVNLDTVLGAKLGYAFAPVLGFLTACPTNVGTGLRASVLIHLPALALTRDLQKILRGALQVGLAVRGLYGEGSETKGNLFQISNQVTLGRSEEEIVEVLGKITKEVISYERKAREYLLEKLRLEIEDKVFRAQALLQNARLLTGDEATNLLGVLRLGVATGMISGPSLAQLNELMILCRPATLQVYYDRELESRDRAALRAELVRARLRVA